MIPLKGPGGGFGRGGGQVHPAQPKPSCAVDACHHTASSGMSVGGLIVLFIVVLFLAVLLYAFFTHPGIWDQKRALIEVEHAQADQQERLDEIARDMARHEETWAEIQYREIERLSGGELSSIIDLIAAAELVAERSWNQETYGLVEVTR